LTTNATPEESLEVLKNLNPFYNNDFGTVSYNVTVDGVEELYEITTFRSEKEYSDFRRPDNISWGKTLEEDVVRRDFTVNAMVVGYRSQMTDHRLQMADHGSQWELIDLVGGLADF
jgi:tRNA nucleotidyltransferase (CCA-adding enzyme)